jgi:hypothetical protein
MSPSSFVTLTLEALDGHAPFFGRRRRVLCAAIDGACGELMMMSPERNVLGVDDEEHDGEDAGLSILRGI